jgi:hypothetical protein
MAKKSESKKTKPKSAGLMTEVAVENHSLWVAKLILTKYFVRLG